MKSYSSRDIRLALEDCGIGRGDLLFFSMRAYALGRMVDGATKDDFNRKVYEAIFEVLGDTGTLVVPTYTQQVGRFLLPYIHEQTPTLTGIFAEYVRQRPDAVRSFHPVFSLTAVGAGANQICGHVGTTAFGVTSAYHYLFEHGGHAACLGFEYERGDIVTGAHYVESTYGVSYYYNKIVRADAYRHQVKSDKVFTINVMYRGFNLKNDYKRYADTLKEVGLLHQRPVGRSFLYTCDLKAQLKVGYDLLSNDSYSFLVHAPCWEEGIIPNEGSAEQLTEEKAKKMNWEGFHLHHWGQI